MPLHTPLPEPIRVLIADDDRVACALIADLIRTDPGLTLVGVAEEGDGLILLIDQCEPDVVLLDVCLPGESGPRTTRLISASRPQVPVLALSASDDGKAVVEMLRAGCVGYLVKDETIQWTPDAIHRAVQGQATLAPAVTGGVIAELVTRLDQEEGTADRARLAEARIEAVLAAGGPDLVFQPIIDLRTQRLLGLEALARFPALPYRPPDRWFAEAVIAGRGVELEVMTAKRVLGHLENVPAGLFVCCNLSPLATASEEMVEALGAGGGDHVVIEITEHAIVEDYEALTGVLDRLRALGVRLSVDDVGAGFASLRHLIRLQPDFIKLDLSLVRGIDIDRPERALTQGIIAFALATEATVVAEGIETLAEMETLQRLGVQAGQGYYWARPAPLSQFRWDTWLPSIACQASRSVA